MGAEKMKKMANYNRFGNFNFLVSRWLSLGLFIALSQKKTSCKYLILLCIYVVTASTISIS